MPTKKIIMQKIAKPSEPYKLVIKKLFTNDDPKNPIAGYNFDKDGNLTLFSLLETICDGINQSTGGATMLEPAIKNDNVVYILEQNFI